MSEAMEGAYPQVTHRHGEQRFYAAAHFRSRLVGERHGQQRVGRDALDVDQPGGAMHQHARLAAAGAGNDQRRFGGRGNGLALRVVQVFEYRGNVHRQPLAMPARRLGKAQKFSKESLLRRGGLGFCPGRNEYVAAVMRTGVQIRISGLLVGRNELTAVPVEQAVVIGSRHVKKIAVVAEIGEQPEQLAPVRLELLALEQQRRAVAGEQTLAACKYVVFVSADAALDEAYRTDVVLIGVVIQPDDRHGDLLEPFVGPVMKARNAAAGAASPQNQRAVSR